MIKLQTMCQEIEQAVVELRTIELVVLVFLVTACCACDSMVRGGPNTTPFPECFQCYTFMAHIDGGDSTDY